MTEVELLRTAAMAAEYVSSIDDRRVAPDDTALAALAAFDEPLSDHGIDTAATLQLLHEYGSPATVASTGPHYYGFVMGATLPVALASSWLAASWDQNTALPAMSPVGAKLHDVVRRWLVELLHLPAETGMAFVTGATVANASCLAAARDALLAGVGWDVQENGLFGAPDIPVVIAITPVADVPTTRILNQRSRSAGVLVARRSWPCSTTG